MRITVLRLPFIAVSLSVLVACGGDASADPATSSGSGSGTSGAEGGEGTAGDGQGGDGQGAAGNEFQISDSDTAGQAHGDRPSEIEASRTHAAMRLFVVHPESGPIPGIVIKMTGPDGTAYYTDQTDSVGYGEVLVPVGQRYELEYLTLGRRNPTANVDVPAGPNQDIRLTLRYRRWRPTPPPAPPASQPDAPPEPEGLVLEGVLFDTNRATIQEESFERLDRVVEYMTHRITTRVRISGHTDNVGNPRRNQQLSEQRAEAVRTYLIENGIDGDRVEAIGYGDQRPVASNDTEDGRAQNRRIEAAEF